MDNMPEEYIEELHKAQTDYEDSLYEIFRKSENMHDSRKEYHDNICWISYAVCSILTILIMLLISILLLLLILPI